MTTPIKRRAFSVDEYHAMVEAGILTKHDRVELLDGEIIAMVPIGSGHASCVMRLSELLSEAVGKRAIVSVQSPVRLDEASEPQPDLMLLKRRDDFYAAAHPTPADVLLLIEVSDTTVAFDKNVKLSLYARSMIPEVWIVNLPETRGGGVLLAFGPGIRRIAIGRYGWRPQPGVLRGRIAAGRRGAPRLKPGLRGAGLRDDAA